MTQTFRLAWQQGTRAIFAEISVVAERNPAGEWSIVLPGDIDPRFSAGIAFGFELFREACWATAHSQGGWRVHVAGIHVIPCDTTITSVAYVAFRALEQALGSKLGDVFVFDRASGAFAIALPSGASGGHPTPA